MSAEVSKVMDDAVARLYMSSCSMASLDIGPQGLSSLFVDDAWTELEFLRPYLLADSYLAAAMTSIDGSVSKFAGFRHISSQQHDQQHGSQHAR
jgi:hypothetical protein